MKYAPDTVQTCITTSQGPVWLAATARGLAGLWFDGQKHFPPALLGLPAWAPVPQHPTLQQAAAQLQQYLQGQKQPAKAATEASLRWQPWRSYAVVRAWATLEGTAPAAEHPQPASQALSNQ